MIAAFKSAVSLSFLIALPFVVGHAGFTALEWSGMFGGVFAVFAWVGAWLPTIIARERQHYNRFAITVLNLVAVVALLSIVGWWLLLLLWPLALIWALTGPRDVWVGVGVWGLIMPTKHTATDSAGRVHKRTSQSRVYSHAVVITIAAHPPTDMWPNGWPASVKAEWASTLTNAQNNANRWKRGRDDVTVEIVPAQIVGGNS